MATRHEEQVARSIDPETAVAEYLQTRREEALSDATIHAHEYRLSHFVRWCRAFRASGRTGCV